MQQHMQALKETEKGPLRYPAFRRIMIARVISGIGSTMQTVAAGWLVLMLSGDPMAVGFLAAIALAPSLIGAPVGGWLADRFCPRKLIILFSVIKIFPPAVLALLAATGTLTVPLIYVLVLAGAIPASVSGPISSLVVPFTVPEEIRYKAVADSSAFYNISLFAGALIGGGLVQFIGAAWAFALNASSYALGAIIFATASVLQRACDRARAHRDSSFRRGVTMGWSFPVVRTVAFGALTFFILVAPIQQLMPVLADDHGEGAMYLGVLLAAITVGSFLGNPVVRKYGTDAQSRPRVFSAGVAIAAPGIILLGLSHWLVVDVVLLVVIGFAWELIFVTGISSLQVDIPADIRGRVIGIFYLLVTGSAALGALLMGWLFSAVGVNPALLGLGVVVAVAALLLNLRPPTSMGAQNVEAEV